MNYFLSSIITPLGYSHYEMTFLFDSEVRKSGDKTIGPYRIGRLIGQGMLYIEELRFDIVSSRFILERFSWFRYNLCHLCANVGGFGEVVLGTHSLSGEMVALKFLKTLRYVGVRELFDLE
jgi:hypothetical protein